MIFDFILLSLLFLPGILLLIALPKKINLRFLEKVLYGSVFWNYLFISSTLLLGLTTNFVVSYFGLFQIIAISVIIGSFMLLIKNRKKTSIPPIKPTLARFPHLIVFLTIVVLCFLLIYFHTLFVEWDAVSYYIPSAKAILTSQGLTSQPYRLLGFFDVSPAIPIMYAWILNFSNNFGYLFSLPIAYFVLTLMVIFLIYTKIFPNKGATIPLLIFMSIPTVLVTISSRALYLDMPFVFFFLSALYSAIRITTAKKEDNSSTRFDYVLFLMGLTLMCLTRIEFGLLLFPIGIAVVLFTFNPKHWQILAVSAIGAVYYIREIRNIFLNQPSWLYYLQRLIPVIIVSFFVFFMLKTSSISQNNPNKLINKKVFTASLLLTIPLIAYLASNILVSGFIVPDLPLTNSDIFKSVAFYSQISPSSTISWVELVRWDNLVTVWWLISPYLIPVAISLSVIVYRLIKKKTMQNSFVPLLFFFAGLLILWSILYCDSQPRRLYYFAPFIAIVAGYGLLKIKKYFTSIGFALRVPTYIITVTIYTLTKMGISSANDLALFYDRLYLPTADIEFLAICTALFVLIFMPYETLLAKLRKNIKIQSITSKMMILFVAGINVVLIMIMVSSVISTTLIAGYQSRNHVYKGWYYYPELVDYYNENITGNGVTIGYFCNELITFANRSTVDLFDPIYGMPIYSMVNDANETEILNRLQELNVEYFLVPQKGTIFYPLFEGLTNSTSFGNLFIDNPQFHALKSFKYATLYKFYKSYQTYPLTFSQVIPWNYNSTFKSTLTSEHNLAKLSGITAINKRLSIMFIPASALNLTQTLWLTTKTYSKATLFLTLFSNLTDRTTDYCSFRIRVNNETRHPVFNINAGTISGNFTQTHVEGILIGLNTEAATRETFGIYNISLVS